MPSQLYLLACFWSRLSWHTVHICITHTSFSSLGLRLETREWIRQVLMWIIGFFCGLGFSFVLLFCAIASSYIISWVYLIGFLLCFVLHGFFGGLVHVWGNGGDGGFFCRYFDAVLR
jgi:hypothetical protein